MRSNRSAPALERKSNISNENCPTCRGTGFYGFYENEGDKIPQYRRCPLCADLWPQSGLMFHEQVLDFGDIEEISPVHRVLRVAGLTILENAAGFVGIFGTTGSVKSEWGKILVASFCRKGIPARYVQAHNLEQALFGQDEDDDGRPKRTVNGGALEIYKRTPVLVIDETQRINWASSWISGHFEDLLDARYRAAGALNRHERQVTVLISQYPFSKYAPDTVQSRLGDGSFQIPWPDGVEAPAGYVSKYGYVRWPIEVKAKDHRPAHESAMKPIKAAALVHPGTGEVLEEFA